MSDELYHAHHSQVYREAADLDLMYDVGEILDNRTESKNNPAELDSIPKTGQVLEP